METLPWTPFASGSPKVYEPGPCAGLGCSHEANLGSPSPKTGPSRGPAAPLQGTVPGPFSWGGSLEMGGGPVGKRQRAGGGRGRGSVGLEGANSSQTEGPSVSPPQSRFAARTPLWSPRSPWPALPPPTNAHRWSGLSGCLGRSVGPFAFNLSKGLSWFHPKHTHTHNTTHTHTRRNLIVLLL